MTRERAPAISQPHLAKASDSDPGLLADDFITQGSRDDLSLLRFQDGVWWKWERGQYSELIETELRASVINYLRKRCTNVKREHVANVLEHVRAMTILHCEVSSPSWIAAGSHDFPATECLATPTKVVNVGRFAAGLPNYSIPATPAFFTHTALPFEVDPNAPQPLRFLQFLNAIWPDDQQSIDTLQEMFGYFLLGDTRQQKIFSFKGPPRCGKGTLARLLCDLIGPRNVAGPTLQSLTTTFGLWSLIGKSLGIVADHKDSKKTDHAMIAQRLLSISGEDFQTVERKNTGSVHCKLPTRLLIMSNELPNLRDASGALVSRMVVLEFKNSFLGREDTALTNKLRAELPGILLWSIQGYRRLTERGHFVQPDSGKSLITQLDELASPVRAFVESQCELDPAATVSKDELYLAFKSWCGTEGIRYVVTKPKFSSELMAAYSQIFDTRLRDKAGKRVYSYGGIHLQDDGEAAW